MRTVTVTGGNLFAIAAAELGDASQWVRIARASGISDPWLSGLVTLQIPARDATYSGDGLPQQ